MYFYFYFLYFLRVTVKSDLKYPGAWKNKGGATDLRIHSSVALGHGRTCQLIPHIFWWVGGG